jgi:hypothetical protein
MSTMDIVFSSALHRDLYRRVEKGRYKEAWNEFSESYPCFRQYEETWLASRKAGGSPLSLKLPWINFPAIDFLRQTLKRGGKAFEWGMGGSTLFLSQYCASVVSVEHDGKWYNLARAEISKQPNSTLAAIKRRFLKNSPQCILVQPEIATPQCCRSGARGYENASFSEYVRVIENWPTGHFDFVLVDGRARVTAALLLHRR